MRWRKGSQSGASGDLGGEAPGGGGKAFGGGGSPVRYVLIIHSNVELGPKMIQFKMNSEIFIQSKNSFKS